jgi:hypothetical protein
MPSDINQGGLGNCYYLAVLSAMAEKPERIQACFYTKTVNSAGIYLMSFFINGNETPVYVDDFLPVRHNRPCFSSSRDGELWVILLEKAWAKLCGSYARTESGFPSIATTHLLGVPSITVFHEDVE